ncbi:hypothetical protein K505DRAFT_147003 [Melanomma pulvis-pyrius CBS 109.77]|uniref:Uncharacterized protein n=1 Tax=Melanomma pulvis-pyrius CBS 109.77 TaxID=1314802 RepID=A0A6A6WRD2_9PLEO|nr:hypothetical protein K505DRAFT_147003 [Melanomma pulvis-pyrius CBS 109.77]
MLLGIAAGSGEHEADVGDEEMGRRPGETTGRSCPNNGRQRAAQARGAHAGRGGSGQGRRGEGVTAESRAGGSDETWCVGEAQAGKRV